MAENNLFLILHNIRSAHNVGSVFRTADGAGVAKLYLTGYTPRPVDEYDRPRAEIVKTALGAEKSVSWEYAKQPTAIIEKLKRDGVRVVALEQGERATTLPNWRPKQATCYIMGNEVRGISQTLLDRADDIVEIPMVGTKESLNVSVAAGIILFWHQFGGLGGRG